VESAVKRTKQVRVRNKIILWVEKIMGRKKSQKIQGNKPRSKVSVQKKIQGKNMENCVNFDCDCCHNELNLDKLCVKKAKIKKACIKELNIPGTFCAEVLSSPALCVDQATARKVDADSACIRSVSAHDICNQNFTSSNAQVVNLVANNVCVPGPLKVADLLNCGKYRASATNSGDINYTLGTNIDWNLITDNPNGNMALGPARYTAPLSGYYMVTFQVKQSNLVPVPPVVILGTPVGHIEILVNGVTRRRNFVPFLTFVNEQGAEISAMLSLNAGDIVESRYSVFAVDSVLGLVAVTGTVTLEAAGNDTESLFKIHLLSIDCGDIMPCVPAIPCTPCTPLICTPCVPRENCDCGCASDQCPHPAPTR
jgi:hypothetical protein